MPLSSWDIHPPNDIRRAAEDLHQGSGSDQTYSIRVDNNRENVVFV